MLDLLFQLISQSVYGALITLIVMPAALAYGAWQGMRHIWTAIRKRGTDGHPRTG